MNITYHSTKKYFTVGFLGWLCFMHVGLAESSNRKKPEHIPTEKIVEFSLMEVREKLQATVDKSEQLSYDNARLRKDISYLKRTLESLAVEKSQLSGRPLSFYYPQEHQSSDRIRNMEERKRRTQILINHFEREISRINEEIHLIEEKLENKEFEAKRDLSLKAIKSGHINLSNLHNRLEKLEKETRGPMKKIESLREEQLVLEQEVNLLEDSIYSVR